MELNFHLSLSFIYHLLKILFKGHRLNSTVINYTHANAGLDCIFLCVRDSKTCRSVNFLKTSNSDRNCEFLKDISSEKPEVLVDDGRYDYYILLNPNRVSIKNHFMATRGCTKGT